MSNDTTTASGTANKRLPQFEAFSVRKYKKNGEHRTARTRIGAAWEHGDSKGCDLVLECFPVNGRISLRRIEGDESQADHA